MWAAVAAGKDKDGYQSISEAAQKMAALREERFIPIPENHQIYEKLYQEYETLHDYFGQGENDVMKKLKKIKIKAKEQK